MILNTMYSFIELKETQKRYILAIMDRFDHTSSEITLKELSEYHDTMVGERAKTGLKLGYPNWLITNENKIRKSVYNLPIPTQEEIDDFNSGNTKPVVNLDKFSPLLKKTIEEFEIEL